MTTPSAEPALVPWAMEASQDGVLILGPDRRVRYAKRAYREMWGLPREFLDAAPRIEDCIRRACREGLYPPDQEEALVRRRLEQLSRRVPGTLLETPRTDGRVVEGRASPLPDGGWIITFRDMTEAVRGEGLPRSAAFYRIFLERTHAVPWELDLETKRFTYMGEQITALTGYPPEAWTDLDSWAGRIHPGDREETVGACMAAIRAAEPHELRYRMITAAGEVRWILDAVTPVPLPEGRFRVFGIFIDITREQEREERLRRAEETVRRVERLETLGLVTSGVAHDFNNLLTPIIAYAELVEAELPEGSPLRSKVARIEAAATQAAVLAQQVLALCRDLGAGPLVVLDLAEAVRRAGELLRMAVPRGVEISIDTSAAGGAAVRADEPRLQQVLLNLCVNAAQAMEGNGRIEIRVEHAGDAARLIVSDEGPGVPDEIRERIFEPFFTTRGGRGGTGIGLATVRRIVEHELGGSIRVSNRPTGGASFEVALPLAEGKRMDAREPEGAGKGKNTTENEAPPIPVLVVGDKRGLVEILVRFLAENGFAPLTAHSPDDIRRLLDLPGKRPAVLVADVDPPDGPGAAAAHAARKLVPDLPAILLVRRTQGGIAEPLAGTGPIQRIEKPTRAPDLLEAIRNSLVR